MRIHDLWVHCPIICLHWCTSYFKIMGFKSCKMTHFSHVRFFVLKLDFNTAHLIILRDWVRQIAKVRAANVILGTERWMHVQGRCDSLSCVGEEPLDKQTIGASAEVLDQAQSANVLISDGHQPAGRQRLQSKGSILHSILPQQKLLASSIVKDPANQIFLHRLKLHFKHISDGHLFTQSHV